MHLCLHVSIKYNVLEKHWVLTNQTWSLTRVAWYSASCSSRRRRRMRALSSSTSSDAATRPFESLFVSCVSVFFRWGEIFCYWSVCWVSQNKMVFSSVPGHKLLEDSSTTTTNTLSSSTLHAFFTILLSYETTTTKNPLYVHIHLHRHLHSTNHYSIFNLLVLARRFCRRLQLTTFVQDFEFEDCNKQLLQDVKFEDCI